jgi:hypothetical protein
MKIQSNFPSRVSFDFCRIEIFSIFSLDYQNHRWFNLIFIEKIWKLFLPQKKKLTIKKSTMEWFIFQIIRFFLGNPSQLETGMLIWIRFREMKVIPFLYGNLFNNQKFSWWKNCSKKIISSSLFISRIVLRNGNTKPFCCLPQIHK